MLSEHLFLEEELSIRELNIKLNMRYVVLILVQLNIHRKV